MTLNVNWSALNPPITEEEKDQPVFNVGISLPYQLPLRGRSRSEGMMVDIWAAADEAAAQASIEKWIEQDIKERYPDEYIEIPQEWLEEVWS